LYEAAGRGVKGVTIKLGGRVRSAEEANLMEDPGRELAVRNDTVKLDFRPFEIKTVRLELEESR
jgi:alpha-mannosidase